MAENETIITMAPNRTPLEKLDANETELLEVCLTALRNFKGSISPSEYFIYNQLMGYGVCGRLTANSIRGDLESFEDNLSDLVDAARTITRQYPELMQPAASRRRKKGELDESSRQNHGRAGQAPFLPEITTSQP